MNRHTPAPWQVEYPQEGEMDQNALITAQGGRELVAEILGPQSDEDGPHRGYYDGLLIAAAPDLLFACSSLIDGQWLPYLPPHMAELVRKAVAKATGAEPPSA